MPLNPLTPFVGYEPNPQGQGYMFQHNNGNKYLSYGPAAEQLRAQIDMSKPKAPQMLALGGPADAAPDAPLAPPIAMPDTGPAPIMAPPPPPPSVAAPEPQRTGTTVDENGKPVEAPPAPPVSEPPGKVVPPDGPLPTMKGASAPAAAGAQPPAPPIPQPGFVYTPGRNPAREAKNAVAVPTAQSVVTEGGIQDPAARQAALDTFHDQVEAQKNLAEVQKNAAASQLDTERANLLDAQRRQQEAEQAIADQEARKVVLRKEFDNRMQIAQKDYDNSSKKEVDQYRMFKGSAGGTVAGILATIGASLGAAATAYRPGMQNYAMQILNQTINNDVDAQRDEIHRGVAKSSNDLKRISDQYNVDYDDAASILKMNYARRAESELAKKAAMHGSQEAQIAFAKVQPEFQKWQADAAADLNASLNGKIKMVQESKMVAPSSGGFAPESAKAYSDRLALEAKNAENAYKIQHGGSAPPKAAGAGDKKDGYTATTLSSINAAETAEHALRHTAALGGMKVDDDGNVSIVDATKFAAAQLPGSKYQKSLEAAIPEVVRGQTGAAPTVEGQEHARHQFDAGGMGVADLAPPIAAYHLAKAGYSQPNAIQENIKLLRSARKVRLENKKYPVVGGSGSGSGSSEEGGGEQ